MKTNNIKIKPQWSKSKEEIWAEKFADLADSPSTKTVSLRRKRIWMYAAAAVVAIALLLPASAYLYTKNISVPRGEHLAVVLPDGSKVQLNAESNLSYKPLWWNISRDVKLNGEAYFEVAKGSDFNVKSGDATVTVLGTSFNVHARPKRYIVTCLTGRVSVSKASQSVVLTPDMKAVYEDNRLNSENISDAKNDISWTTNRFVFSGVPLYEVVAEIERQYNIEVVATDMKSDYLYSGNFYKTEDPEQLLQSIGKPFGVELKIK